MCCEDIFNDEDAQRQLQFHERFRKLGKTKNTVGRGKKTRNVGSHPDRHLTWTAPTFLGPLPPGPLPNHTPTNPPWWNTDGRTCWTLKVFSSVVCGRFFFQCHKVLFRGGSRSWWCAVVCGTLKTPNVQIQNASTQTAHCTPHHNTHTHHTRPTPLLSNTQQHKNKKKKKNKTRKMKKNREK